MNRKVHLLLEKRCIISEVYSNKLYFLQAKAHPEKNAHTHARGCVR